MIRSTAAAGTREPSVAPFLMRSHAVDPADVRYARAYTRRVRDNMRVLSRTSVPEGRDSGLFLVRSPERLADSFRHQSTLEGALLAAAALALVILCIGAAFLDASSMPERVALSAPAVLTVATLLYVRTWGAVSQRGTPDLVIGIQDGWLDMSQGRSVSRIHTDEANRLLLVPASSRNESIGLKPDGTFVMSREGWIVVDAELRPTGVEPVKAVLDNLRPSNGLV